MSKESFYDEPYDDMVERVRAERDAIPKKIILVTAAGLIYVIACAASGAHIALAAMSLPIIVLALYILVQRYKDLETF